MTDKKFTPGPWTAVHNGHYYEISVPSRDGAKVYNHSPSLASTIDNKFVPGFTNETEKANAYMLAAAPELYESLSLLMSHLPDSQCSIWKDVKGRARQALANATGDTL